MMRPEEIYQRIEGQDWRHIWVVGDIHGCFSILMKKLREYQFDPQQDLLVSVGDIIDRGPDSLRSLALLRESWMRAVRGNHEQMALDARTSSQSTLWFMNGGDWFTRLTAEQTVQAEMLFTLCQRLPWILEIRCRHNTHVIAHADYPSPIYQWQKKVDLHQVLWSRERLMKKSGGITGADHFWFGHTPLRRRMDFDNVHYIDTGAVFGGQLTLAQIQ
ncbi:serine/threonine-protein phosphatase [Salmonella enterica subsp. arizonae serovar 53:-:- str. SA20100345]|nr:serine/threonine-protein phosphatase [Salmonella enterica subsp. arizonae serovar 53:-:- str. SA20100345]ECX9455383.1 protein-serine/threonine phosphatase [Salmonella enterica]